MAEKKKDILSELIVRVAPLMDLSPFSKKRASNILKKTYSLIEQKNEKADHYPTKEVGNLESKIKSAIRYLEHKPFDRERVAKIVGNAKKLLYSNKCRKDNLELARKSDRVLEYAVQSDPGLTSIDLKFLSSSHYDKTVRVQDTGSDARISCVPGEAGPLLTISLSENKWSQISAIIKELVPTQQYKTWFKSMNLKAYSDKLYRFTVPNLFLKSWIEKFYFDVIKESVRRASGYDDGASIIIETERSEQKQSKDTFYNNNEEIPLTDPFADTEATSIRSGKGDGSNVRSRATSFFLNPNYNFHDFVVGPCNQLSHAAALAVSDNPAVAYNPLFLHGSSGLGKTHILQAICHESISRFSDRKLNYISCELFINHFISSIEKGKMDDFRNRYRNIDILLIDDVHLLANKERTQEEFFHTFNALFNNGKQIVLTGDSPPSDIPTLEERLVSRFKWGLVCQLEPPDFETRLAILKLKARLKNVDVPDDVSSFLAENITTNVRELEGAITKVIGYSTLMDVELNLHTAQEAMKDVILKRRKNISIDHIVNNIAKRYNVKLSDLQSKKRNHSVAIPRQIAMYTIKNMTSHSLQEIGSYFGGRDHTTVLYAYNRINERLKGDEQFRISVDKLLDCIKETA